MTLSNKGAKRLRVRGVDKLFSPKSMDAEYNTTGSKDLAVRDWDSEPLVSKEMTLGTPRKKIGPFTDFTS